MHQDLSLTGANSYEERMKAQLLSEDPNRYLCVHFVCSYVTLHKKGILHESLFIDLELVVSV